MKLEKDNAPAKVEKADKPERAEKPVRRERPAKAPREDKREEKSDEPKLVTVKRSAKPDQSARRYPILPDDEGDKFHDDNMPAFLRK